MFEGIQKIGEREGRVCVCERKIGEGMRKLS